MNKPLVSVVIPAFNEEHSIGPVLQAVRETLKKIDFPYEIIVVNDGSTDRTAEIAKENNVILIENGKNQGKGFSLRMGFLRAKGYFIVTMDADGSHQPEDLPTIISPLLNYKDIDVVIGTRFNNNEVRNLTSRLHLVGNRLINLIILFLTGKYISDSQSGYRAFTRDALRKISLSSSRYEVETEMTIEFLKKRYKIFEVPINCKERRTGHTKINSFKDGFKILKTILIVRSRR